jgi:PAS domain S-box-containing protein
VNDQTANWNGASGTVQELAGATAIGRPGESHMDFEDRYRRLLEAVPLGIEEIDISGVITFSNHSHHAMLGYEDGELIGQPVWSLAPSKAEEERWRTALDQIIAQQAPPTPFECKCVSKDGRLLDFRVDWTYRRDTLGRLTGFICVISDVTEQKRLETVRNRHRQALAALVEFQRGLLGMDSENGLSAKILEPLGEAFGASRVWVFMKRGDDREQTVLCPHTVWCAPGVGPANDDPHQASATGIDWFSRWVEPLSEGKVVSGVVSDLSESERAILEPQGILAVTALPLVVNGEFYGFVALDNSVEARAWDSWELDVLRGVAAAVSLALERTDMERRMASQRETLQQEAKERSEKLLEAQRQLLQTEKLASVGQLAAGVAHEINTPIQFIGDNLHALSDSFGDLRSLVESYREVVESVEKDMATPDGAAAVREAERDYDLEYILDDSPKAIAQGLEGVDRVSQIVRAMKDFSHVDRGELTFIDLNQSLRSTLTVARNEYKYVAEVETDFRDLPAVECYGGELNQVFLNLLVNAAHAIGDTGERGTITITTRHDGDFVEVSFADTGTGIPEEVRDKVLDPFFTTKAVGKGTGQGLSIAHSIVVGKHGGDLRFETETGKGTTFFLRIPVQAVHPAESSREDQA